MISNNDRNIPVSDREVGFCLESKGNGDNLGGGNGPALQAGSKISSQPLAKEETTASWSKKRMGRRVRCDKEDPSCTE